MARVRSFLSRAAEVDASVLLVGETGTGKGLLARLLHTGGGRSAGPFVAVNCAGVPDGLFESEFFGHQRGAFTGAQASRPGFFEEASGGTLFLDEVGDLPKHQQAKLLTALEDRCVRRLGGTRLRAVDVRVVAATRRDLGAAVRAGAFRVDLFHRLAVLCLHIPPLRTRPEDIAPLLDGFLDELGRRHGRHPIRMDQEARALLERHSWPGNVRELRHVIEAAIILAQEGVIRAADVEGLLSRAVPGDEAGAEARPSLAQRARAGLRGRYSFLGSRSEEREMIRGALVRNRGNRTQTAAELGMSRTTLRMKLADLGVDLTSPGVD